MPQEFAAFAFLKFDRSDSLMPVLVILTTLGAVLLSMGAPDTPADHPAWKVTVMVGLLGLPAILGWCLALRTARRLPLDYDRRREILQRFARWQSLLTVVWTAGVLVAILALSWPQIVQANWQLGPWPLLGELVLLAPLLAPQLVAWAAFHRVDTVWRNLARARGVKVDEPVGCLRFVARQSRSQLGLFLLPVLGLFATEDLTRWLFPQLFAGDWGWMVYAVPLACMFAGFPWLLRLTWRVDRIAEGSLRSMLVHVSHRWGTPVGNFWLWHTDAGLVNAAVTGCCRPVRSVFLTDGLLRHLTEAQLIAVVGHELGHVRDRHLAIRAAVMALPLALVGAVRWLLPGWQSTGVGEHLVRMTGEFESLSPHFSGMVSVLLLGLYVLVVFGMISRRLEAQADDFGCLVVSDFLQAGCQHGSPMPTNPSSAGIRVYISALEVLAVANGISHARRSWQHGSLASRIARLKRQLGESQPQPVRPPDQPRTQSLSCGVTAITACESNV